MGRPGGGRVRAGATRTVHGPRKGWKRKEMHVETKSFCANGRRGGQVRVLVLADGPSRVGAFFFCFALFPHTGFSPLWVMHRVGHRHRNASATHTARHRTRDTPRSAQCHARPARTSDCFQTSEREPGWSVTVISPRSHRPAGPASSATSVRALCPTCPRITAPSWGAGTTGRLPSAPPTARGISCGTCARMRARSACPASRAPRGRPHIRRRPSGRCARGEL